MSRWSKEEIEKCKQMIRDGLSVEDMGLKIGRTTKAIRLKFNRLGIQITDLREFYEEVECLNCGELFEELKSHNRKFCSSNCAATFNNKGRVHTKETKRNISDSKKQYHKNSEYYKEPENKKCGYEKCDNTFEVKHFNLTQKFCCRKCFGKHTKETNKGRQKELKYYRQLCSFEFNVYDYPEEFNLNLLEKYGWYQPVNRGNNLDGVSRDHMYSVRSGFENQINPKIISHPANCQLLIHNKNNRKNTDNSLSLDELKSKIIIWEQKYNDGVAEWLTE